MRYNNTDNCSNKDPFFDVILDLTKDRLMSDEDFDKYFLYLKETKSFKENIVDRRKDALEKRKNEFTKFERYLLMRIMSINMAYNLYKRRLFNIPFTKDHLYEGYGGEWYYDADKLYKDRYLTNWIGDVDVNMYHSINEVSVYYHFPLTLVCKETHDNYFDEDENRGTYYIGTLYTLYQYIKQSGKLNIIDKGDYIMFHKNKSPLHLERTPDNDVEWTEDMFDKAFERIYNIYINNV